ncbi:MULTISPECIES: molybdenum cofactor guanylyltransferase [unclassified Microbacterium]|uniref:molybdenum cofactor guanylyltransferase n=1 Tax=unclassified Microbacterium TaxID=2609290 RepID=UPI00301AB1AE
MAAADSDSPTAPMPVGAVVLVGGRARRMGGAAKHLLAVGGTTPWDRTLGALAANGISPVVAVGPAPADGGGPAPAAVTWVREDPPFGGPVAALAAALSDPVLDDTGEFLLLAGDLAHPEAVIARLREADPAAARTAPGGDAEALVFDAAGRPQWLAGRYRTAAVRAALAALGETDGASCRALLGGLPIRWIPDEDGITADIDTPDDLERARAEAAGAERPEESR